MSEESDDKQFDPTEQRLRKARENGDIPRSIEVNAALSYLGFALSLLVLLPVLLRAWVPMAARALGDGDWPRAGFGGLAASVGGYAALAVMGVVTIPAVVVLVGVVAQRGFVVSGKKIKPDFNKINPVKNARQKFGKSGLTTFAISAGKAMMVGVGGWFLFAAMLPLLADAGLMRDRQWTAALGLLLGRVLALAVAISVVFGLLDFLAKWYQHRQKLRMSLKEMRDEHKESEGDPMMKSHRRQKAVDIATNKMLEDVHKADVIIVNPTHYAVALEWKRGSGRAPVCLAKGVDEIAARIRERATEHKVPIWSDPPCARAIHASVEIGKEIQPDQFRAVAAAIRFAEAMREKARKGW